MIKIKLIGQSGCCLEFDKTIVYLDPYLSNSVQELDAADLTREVPIFQQPEDIKNADHILITHAHIDHCDPKTLPKISKASPKCQFWGPKTVLEKFKQYEIPLKRSYLVKEEWTNLSEQLKFRAVVAAHPNIIRDNENNLECIGYLIKYQHTCIYIAGDTLVNQDLIDYMKPFSPINIGILPVNEINFFRNRRGIIGNMSVREAFLLVEELKIQQLIPVHWDMFAANSVYPEEIQIIYNQMKPGFNLLLAPEVVIK